MSAVYGIRLVIKTDHETYERYQNVLKRQVRNF